MAEQQSHSVAVLPTYTGNVACACGRWSQTWSSPFGRDRAIADAAQHLAAGGFTIQISRRAPR